MSLDDEIDAQISALLAVHSNLLAAAERWAETSSLIASNHMDLAERIMKQIERLWNERRNPPAKRARSETP